MDLFIFAYYGAICGVLAYSAPLLETSLRRLLLGLTTGLIAATAMPYVRDMLTGSGH
ncbi:MAG: hypothetical protein ACI861_000055 [Paracoccaceae bacterium]|jgi:hypothetical protein